MSVLPRCIALYTSTTRSIAMTALLGASFAAMPLTAACAADAPNQTNQLGAEATDTHAETVEQRITNLHAELKITPSEEAKWNDVAQAMRENAAAMEKLVAAKTLQAPSSVSAVEDLKGYEKFAQAHVDGLKNLIASFETLYVSFSDAQKKTADEVFQTFGQKGHSSHT